MESKLAEAVDILRRKVALTPEDAGLHSQLISLLDHDGRVGARGRQQERRQWWLQHVACRNICPMGKMFKKTLAVDRKLRVGYVAADRHLRSAAFGPLLRDFDRDGFEVVCYSNSGPENEATPDFYEDVTAWHYIAGIDDETVCRQIIEDGIDILIDLCGHAEGSRLMVFAWRPAPIQVTTSGQGTGMSEIDYLFADAATIPRRDAYFYAEEIVDVPHDVRAFEAAYRRLWLRLCCQNQGSFNVETKSLNKQVEAAIAVHRQGALNEAAAKYAELLEDHPAHPDLLHLLGTIAYQKGQYEAAVRMIAAAVGQNPGAATYHSNLGNVWRELGQMSEAIACYLRAAALEPGNSIVASNLCDALNRLSPEARPEAVAAAGNRNDGAVRPSLVAALRAGRDVVSAVAEGLRTESDRRKSQKDEYDRAVTTRLAGNLKGALEILQAILDRDPGYADAHHGMVALLEGDTNSSRVIADFRRTLQEHPRAPQLHSVIAYSTDFDPSLDAAAQQEERKRWYRQQIVPQGIPRLALNVDRDPERKLRIGFIPGRYYFNPSASTYLPVMLQLDPRHFEVYCYDAFPNTDDLTLAIRRRADGWCDITQLTDREVAERIRDDRIDILVDLFAHAGANRLPIYEYKPAPIQVTAWGHANGTGMATMDYLFSDPVSIPPEETGFYAEHIHYLPCQLSYWLPEQAPPVAKLPAVERQSVTFGCFNRMIKISEEVFALWGELLSSVPDSHLVLKSHEFSLVEQRIKAVDRFAAMGIDPVRIVLYPGSAWFDHLDRYGEVDIALDPFPMGGGVTTLDALWMGVPVVCLKGRTLGQRITSAIMTAVGLDDWAAESKESYLALAIAKARALPELARVRRTLRRRMAASPLANPEYYVRSVEHAFRAFWRQWCADPASRVPSSGTAAFPICDEVRAAETLWRDFLRQPDDPDVARRLAASLERYGKHALAREVGAGDTHESPELPAKHGPFPGLSGS